MLKPKQFGWCHMFKRVSYSCSTGGTYCAANANERHGGNLKLNYVIKQNKRTLIYKDAEN